MTDRSSMQDSRHHILHHHFPPATGPTGPCRQDDAHAPDHGEQSYAGFGRLLGRKALITGGDSGIGRAAAIAFCP